LLGFQPGFHFFRVSLEEGFAQPVEMFLAGLGIWREELIWYDFHETFLALPA